MAEVGTQNSTATESLEERLARIERDREKEKRGLLTDIQGERDKRHALERRLEEMEQALNSAAKEPEVSSNQDEVNRLAQDPRSYIREVVSADLKRELESRDKRMNLVESSIFEDRAYRFLAKQEKLDVEDIYGSELESEIVRITKEHGMGLMNVVEGTKAAYKIYQQEKRSKEEAEKKRNENISSNATHSVRSNSSSSGTQVFSRSQIGAMSRDEFMKNHEAILKAQREGKILNE